MYRGQRVAGFTASTTFTANSGANTNITSERDMKSMPSYDKTGATKRALLFLAGYAFLAACSTQIYTQQEIPTATRQSMVVKEATAEVAKDVLAPPDIGSKLVKAVLTAASDRANGSMPVNLKMTVVRYEMVSGEMRLFTGMFGGSNKLYVAVDVLDGRNETVIGHYDVLREANPSGYGAFYDQAQATIDAAAAGVVDGLYGTATASGATAPKQP